VENIVFNLFAKFNDDRLWNEKAVVHWKSDKTNKRNKHKDNNKITVTSGDPFLGPRIIHTVAYKRQPSSRPACTTPTHIHTTTCHAVVLSVWCELVRRKVVTYLWLWTTVFTNSCIYCCHSHRDWNVSVQKYFRAFTRYLYIILDKRTQKVGEEIVLTFSLLWQAAAAV